MTRAEPIVQAQSSKAYLFTARFISPEENSAGTVRNIADDLAAVVEGFRGEVLSVVSHERLFDGTHAAEGTLGMTARVALPRLAPDEQQRLDDAVRDVAAKQAIQLQSTSLLKNLFAEFPRTVAVQQREAANQQVVTEAPDFFR